jgi:thioredoxin reductase
VRWDRLVLATGARPRRLRFAAPEGVHVLRSLADAAALRGALVPETRLVIVGGGFVGAEVASTAAALGVQVTMLDAGEAPFACVLGPELGQTLAARYREHGVDLRLRTTAAALAGDDRVRAVLLADGTEVPCDAVLVAIGAAPARELARPGIEICGDAAGGPGHWTAAAHSGANAARRLLRLAPLPAQPSFFWSDQFGLRLQLVGEPAQSASVALEGDEHAFVARFHARSGRLVAALAANRAGDVGALRRELALAA